MKRFHELTKEQQKAAIEFARAKVHEMFNHGVIMSNRQPTPQNMTMFAECMAEDAYYSEKDDAIVADIADGK